MVNIEALILAAGLSSRMGKNKLLLRVKGATIIEKTVAVIMASPISGINVVLGNEGSEIKKALAAYPVNFIGNPNYASGMSSSIKCGIQSLIKRENVNAALLILGDMPCVSNNTINKLINEFEVHHNLIIAPRYNGRRGHPVLFSREVFQPMMELKGDSGARGILQSYRDQVFCMDVNDPGIITDLDTKDDLRNYINQLP